MSREKVEDSELDRSFDSTVETILPERVVSDSGSTGPEVPGFPEIPTKHTVWDMSGFGVFFMQINLGHMQFNSVRAES